MNCPFGFARTETAPLNSEINLGLNGKNIAAKYHLIEKEKETSNEFL